MMAQIEMRISNPQKNVDSSEFAEMSRLLPFEGAQVLELGCGRARWTRTLAERLPLKSIIATEVDAVQHQKNLQITDLPNVSFRYGGAESIALEDDSVDLVIMLKSLHHVPMEQMGKALQEIYRVLKPGGLAYFSEPVYAGDFNEILRLFNDEKSVRQAAFNALREVVDGGLFELVEEVFFLSESRFEDYSEFEERILFATHLDKEISTDLQQKVKAAFTPHLGEGGAVFRNPQRIDLLRKRIE